jgi:hypothetical protein
MLKVSLATLAEPFSWKSEPIGAMYSEVSYVSSVPIILKLKLSELLLQVSFTGL